MADTDLFQFLIQYAGEFTWPKRWRPEAFLAAIQEVATSIPVLLGKHKKHCISTGQAETPFE